LLGECQKCLINERFWYITESPTKILGNSRGCYEL
jgi:hypothetical protein